MRFITTSVIRCRHIRRLIFSFVAVCALACTQAAFAQGGVHLTITKTDDAPNPIPSGQVFTYTIAYSWSGGVGWSGGSPGTLVITDAVPTSLDVMSTAPGSPVGIVVGNNVTFTLNCTAPSGAGTVQINVRFKPGVTCPGTVACNTAIVMVKNDPNSQVSSNRDCVTATATNKWQFRKDYISGCMLDSAIVYRISVINPSGGDIGGLNLTSVSLTDILPPGAIITSVTGNWTGFAPPTGTVSLTGGPTSFTVAGGWSWSYVYVTVKYPTGSFAVGQTVTNNAQLRFQTPCSDGQFLTMNASASNTICSGVLVNNGYLGKWLSLWLYFPANPWYTPSWAPGCCGTYGVYYYNNGGTTQSGIVIDDNLPATVDVGTVMTYQPPSMTSVKLDVYCYVSGTCLAAPSFTTTYTSPGTWLTYSPGVLPGPICRLKWTYTGTLAPGAYLYNTINACLRSNNYATGAPVLAGDHTINTACVTGVNVPAGLCATSDYIVSPTAPNILTAKFFEGKSGSCMPGCTPSTAGPYYPGDIVRWRMVIANVGSATATPCTITDLLPAGFSYMGGETYYYGPIVFATTNNPTCCTLTGVPPTGTTGPITSPPIGAINLITWSFPTLPADCGGSVNYLVIEFDTKASAVPTIPPGNYFNTFTFSAGNLGTPVTSNPAQVTINGYAKMEVFKEVRPYITGTSFSSSANVQPGNDAEYRLRISNTGILTLANIQLMDILPHTGDISVLPLPAYFPRASAFDLPISVGVYPAVAGYTYWYNNLAPIAKTNNPSRTPFFCSVVDPVAPPVWVGTWTTTFLPTFSFRIAGGVGAWIAPATTQDFYFRATVPPATAVGLTACNSYGVQATPYGTSTCLKVEATPACVTVIPPTKNGCDSIWGQVQVDPCCTFSTTVLNTLGTITELDYNVLPPASPGGVVQSITTSPCLPTSTIPASLAGTTSGSLFYTPPCASPLGVQVHLSSTTPSGDVCIELIANITNKKGQKIQCRDTVCIHCDPAPKTRCDSLAVKAFPNGNYSSRTFTIFNLKSPASPICSVKIAVTPPPPGGLTGGSLVINGTAHAWPSGAPSTWTVIAGPDGLPATSTVAFNLNVIYGVAWVGTVTITVYHCDGDSCTMDYGPWDPSKKVPVIGVGTATDVPDRTTLHMHALTFSRADAADKHIRSIAVNYSDAVTEIVAVTGATYPCDADNGEQANCNDIFEGVHVSDRSLMLDLRRNLDDPLNVNDPVVTVVYRTGPDGGDPTVEIVYYDENGQEVGHDDVDVRGEDPPGRAISGLGGDRMAMVMGALTAHPNPTTGRVDVGFTLQAAGTVDLELVDARGTKVATVITGEHFDAGEHHRMLEMSMIPSGTYLVSMRVNGVPSVLRLEVTK